MGISSHQLRTICGFWFLGLINNVLYVIILSAALDLVGPTIPKGLVLLADVLPSFLVKLIAPYFIHVIPYPVRVLTFVALSAGGMLIIALSTDAHTDAHSSSLSTSTSSAGSSASVALKLFGVALASVSSGGGELSFLGLTHWYGRHGLAAWSSGTGAAGLVGAGAYVLVTGRFGLSSRVALLVGSALPVFMLVAFFGVLPKGAVGEVGERDERDGYVSVPEDETEGNGRGHGEGSEHEEGEDEGEEDVLSDRANGHLKAYAKKRHGTVWQNFKFNLQRAQGLFFPYMLPLLLVYIAEYTINQGIAPTLLFPLEDSPFKSFREFYPTYNAIYQLGVFISRSSTPFIRIHHLYTPSILQVLNLAVLTCQSLLMFLPNVWLVFIVIFWEGLLGGLVYVNTFAEISDNVPVKDREFSLSATTVSDSGGICIAALISMVFETALCDWQVKHGRDWCRRP